MQGNYKNDIKYTITAYVPGNLCNLRCEYCYVSKCADANHMTKGVYKYPIETMIKAFDPKRLGGIAAITVIGAGETLIDDSVIPFVHGLLKQGHLVSIVTNLTLNNRIDELLNIEDKYLKRLVVKGSLHWNELKRLNKVDDYFNNMNKVLKKGASSYPFLVCGDSYVPYLEEIKQVCLEKINALPHCTPSMLFEEKCDIRRMGTVQTSPKCTPEFVEKINKLFDSKIFNLCAKWLSIDPKEVFCYAGKWSFCVYIGNGDLVKCHGCPKETNFFENLNKMPKLEAIGRNCQIASCMLQYDFISQGIIPEEDDLETFGDILKKDNLINEEVRNLLNFKYTDKYRKYGKIRQIFTNIKTNRMFHKKNWKYSLKNCIRLEIYSQLKTFLKKKGLI